MKVNEENGEHYFTLHMRYALRKENSRIGTDDEEQLSELPPEYVNTILNFIIGEAAREDGAKTERIKNLITMIAAIIAAAAAVIGAIISTIK